MAKAKAKKGASRMATVQTERVVRPVRLDLSEADHERLERLARERGLNKASYARQAVLERMRADEGSGK
jgi:hypothetical protein